jgi:2-phospho-L-lactate/phosphoenolpyruvate guanylyltransferase
MEPGERASLAREMMDHVLEAVVGSGAMSGVAVISPDEIDLPEGVTYLRQRRAGLNNLLEEGRHWALEQGAEAVMVVFADLPLLSAADVARIVEMAREPGTVVLAPDRHETGTNVMLARPVSLAQFAFGPGSYARHRELYEEAGAIVRTYVSRGTSLDIDTPGDLSQLETNLAALEF